MKKADLKSPNSRKQIATGPKLHVAYICQKLYLGYRKSKSTAAWYGRRYKPDTKKNVTQFLGVPDDVLPANDVNVLSHDQPVERAKKWFNEEEAKEQDSIVVQKTYTVSDLMTDYLKDRKDDGCKSLRKIERTIKTHILPTLGSIPLHKLNHRQVKTWLDNLAESAPRLRTTGTEPVFRAIDPTDEEYERKRKATANVIWNTLRASLNYAYRSGKIHHKRAWDRVQSFAAASKPRIVETTIDEIRELVAACEPDFRQLVKGSIYSGCRVSELANLRVRNFYPGTQQIHLEDTKNGHERFVPLNGEAIVLFEELTAHRQPDEYAFLKANGNPWRSGDQQRPMLAALAVAGITKPLTFHQLRHAYASLSLQSGLRLEEVAEILGHRDLKVCSRHYARFSGSHLLDKVRECAPQLGMAASTGDSQHSDKVIPFRKAVGAS